MPFRSAVARWAFGMDWWGGYTAYCQVDPNASDYGKCYNIATGRAVFVLSTGTPACVSDNTCIQLSPSYIIYLSSYYSIDYTGVGKQAILHELSILENTNNTEREPLSQRYHFPFITVALDGTAFERGISLFMPNVRSTNWQGYDPQSNWFGATDFFSKPAVGTQIFAKIVTTRFFQKANPILWNYQRDNVYSSSVLIMFFSFEASPLAIIPLDYDEYSKYQELRKAFGYNSNGVDQPGWNAQDIINILKEIFQDKVWMVFDDSTLTLYGYGITLEQVPQWLIDMLNPVAFKVLKDPWDLSLVKKFISELESRNYVKA